MAKWLTDPATGQRVRHVSRSECGLPASRAPKGRWEREHAIAHHGVGRGNGVPLREAMALWRGYYRYHVEGRGWNDIGYSYGWADAPDVGGAVLDGRGWGRDGAHTQNGGNSLGYAACYIGDGRKPVADSAWRAWRAWLAEGVRKGALRAKHKLSDHNDWYSKLCAGSQIRGPLHERSGLDGGPDPEPEPDPEDDDMKMELWTGPDPDRPNDDSDHKWLIQRDMAAPGTYLGYFTRLTPAEAKHYGNLADNPDRGDVIKATAKAARSWFTDARLARKE